MNNEFGRLNPSHCISELLNTFYKDNLEIEGDILKLKDNVEYEEKAFCIATNSTYLKDLKCRLRQSRTKSSLFDTKGFTENLEKIYIKLVSNL